MNNWICAKEQLPDGDKDCIVFISGYGPSMKFYNERHQCWDDEDGDDFYCSLDDGKITHWMELPDNPK